MMLAGLIIKRLFIVCIFSEVLEVFNINGALKGSY